MESSVSKPNLLYVVHRVPYPPDKGDRIRAFNLVKFLGARSRLHLACLADESTSDSVRAALAEHVERLAIVPLRGWSRWPRALASLGLGRTVTEGAFSSSALRRTLGEWAKETKFAATIASASSVAPYLRMPGLRAVPALVDLVDLDSEKWLEYSCSSRGFKASLYGTEGRRLRKMERELKHWARAITLVSEAEADLYRQACGEGPVHAVSNGVDLDYFRPRTVERAHKSAVFVGALDYRPNVDGVCWFCEQVWPEIHRRRPDVKLYLVGRQPVLAVRKLGEIAGVEVVGQVPDVRPYLAEATLAVVPLRIARGIQNKVLEAMAMGRPVVASPEPLQGLDAVAGRDVLSASAPRDWVEQTLRLLDDEELCQRMGTCGRAYVEEYHRWDRQLEPLARLLAPLGVPMKKETRVAVSQESPRT